MCTIQIWEDFQHKVLFWKYLPFSQFSVYPVVLVVHDLVSSQVAVKYWITPLCATSVSVHLKAACCMCFAVGWACGESCQKSSYKIGTKYTSVKINIVCDMLTVLYYVLYIMYFIMFLYQQYHVHLNTKYTISDSPHNIIWLLSCVHGNSCYVSMPFDRGWQINMWICSNSPWRA